MRVASHKTLATSATPLRGWIAVPSDNSRAYFVIYNAFAFWIDFICIIYVGIVIFSFFFIASDVRVGNIGLALIQLFQLERDENLERPRNPNDFSRTSQRTPN
ncbi:hypothetical protein MTP99_006989 [Tenebrio molitor]|nr:hypothetical protein MTP99_006989 [Tenebrio molitor]